MDENIQTNNEPTIEEENQGVQSIEPFDPNLIKIRIQPYTIGQIIDSLLHDEIKIDTEFQRLPDLWEDTKKSRLIESLLLNLPIPAFYFNGEDDKVWEVVDGLQRISAVKSFVIDKSLSLTNLEFLKDYENKKYEELPRDLQRRINTFQITIYVIEKGTPNTVKYNLFKRINQGGLVLTPQEIRHAIHQGIASELVKEIVNKDNEIGQAFIQATEKKVPSKRMEDRDFATRFISFYLISYEQYEPDLDTFMNKGMDAIKTLSKDAINELKTNFRNAMKLAYNIFEKDTFRKRINLTDARYPINKALFETLSVSLSRLSSEQQTTLQERKDKLKEKFRKLHHDQKFLTSITQNTASKENVKERFRCIEQIIQETLK
jgi:hypothetical protein